jgi:hypothetical protein|tara:strand:- start:49 stop:717 length:669 start_codon:yes stop_codon:yes gene_type:complete
MFKPTKIMRKILIIIFFSFLINNTVFSNSISDFTIGPFGINEKLTELVKKSEIESTSYFPIDQGSNKEMIRYEVKQNLVPKDYDGVMLSYSFKNKDFKILNIEGVVNYTNNFKGCNKKRVEIAKEIQNLFENVIKWDGNHKNVNKKIIFYEQSAPHFIHKDSPVDQSIFGFKFREKDLKPLDFITVSCYDWSEKSGYQDEMRITVTSEKYELWLEKINKKQN